ncbi:MAG: hypothetical protein GXO69_04630 [Acidobacteria bacterium]|nr:hypothetical protein [Acidobacteriota bacterium]
MQTKTGSRSSICHSQITGHESLRPRRIYMLARYYTAGSGKFLQVDPGDDYDPIHPMSFNLYGYVRENPVMGTDPTGTNRFKIDGKWQWEKGDTYTDKDQDRREQTLHSDYKNLKNTFP